MKPKLLCIMQLPPPVHGQSVVNSIVDSSKAIREKFDYKAIPLRFADLLNLGKFSFKKILKMLLYCFVIIGHLMVFRPKLVYFTITHIGAPFYRDCVFVFILKLFRKKIVFHLHGKGIKNNLDSSFKRFLYRNVFKNCSIIVLAESLKYDIESIAENCNIYTLANGLPGPDQTCNSKNQSAFPELLFLSNIEITKGVFTLLDSLEILKKNRIEFKAVFAGGLVKSISLLDFERQIETKELKDFVSYVGPVYGEDKSKILNKADVFVFPTYNDCFPLVILEAMQDGLPVVSTFEGAIPDIVDDGVTGFLVPQKNPQALAEKLKILINNPELRLKMGEAGRKKFFEKYTVDKFENNLVDIFNKILEK